MRTLLLLRSFRGGIRLMLAVLCWLPPVAARAMSEAELALLRQFAPNQTWKLYLPGKLPPNYLETDYDLSLSGPPWRGFYYTFGYTQVVKIQGLQAPVKLGHIKLEVKAGVFSGSYSCDKPDQEIWTIPALELGTQLQFCAQKTKAVLGYKPQPLPFQAYTAFQLTPDAFRVTGYNLSRQHLTQFVNNLLRNDF